MNAKRRFSALPTSLQLSVAWGAAIVLAVGLTGAALPAQLAAAPPRPILRPGPRPRPRVVHRVTPRVFAPLPPRAVRPLIIPRRAPRLVIPPRPAIVIRPGIRVVHPPLRPAVVAGVTNLVVAPSRQFVVSEAHRVVRVDDRFLVTLLIGGVETPVRMVGVDPPLVASGEGLPKPPEAARQFIENLLVGELVYVDRDPVLAQKDAEGNLVAYLYRAPDMLPINLELIRQGYGLVAEDYRFTFQQAFLAHEQKARAARRGIWALTSGTDL